MPPILYMIDGHALAYRTYFALTSGSGDRMQTSQGEPTAGIYGFISVLLKLIESEKPEYLAVAFDTGKTFRNDLYPEYKATRAKMPDDLKQQIERLRQIIDAFGIPRLEMEGVEADDVLGSIARQAVKQGFGVKIITGDRDLLQLVNERVIVNLPGGKLSEAKDYTDADVIAYFGVRPDQVIDYKALVGDPSDNYPGVPGVGQKTAVTLLNQYQTLDNIYAHLEEIPARFKTKLEAGKESAYLSEDLATIRTDVAITLDMDQAKTGKWDIETIVAIFKELEFKSLLARLRKVLGAESEPLLPTAGQLSLFENQGKRVGTPPPPNLEVRLVDTPETLADLVQTLSQASLIAFDTETTSTDPMLADLVGISLAVEENIGYYIPVGHNQAQKQLPLADVIRALKPSLSNPQIEKAGHNLKYDGLVLLNHGIKVTPYSFDSMIAGWLIDPASYNLGLKDMADSYLNLQMTHIEELIGKGKSQINMADVAIEKAAPYAAADAAISLQLVSPLREKLAQFNALKVFQEIEMPLIPVLMEMEKNGIDLDVPFLKQMSAELNKRMLEIETAILDSVGFVFNLNSTQQLSKVLFETLKLSPPNRGKKTSSGHFSTSADVLEELRGQHPVVDWILEYRELAKLKSTYVDALPLQVNPKTGRVHTSFNQTGSVTGRLASTNPNLQNIPTRTDLGRTVRKSFIAQDGYVLLSVDYSQIELRIVAHMSGDKNMLAAFKAGQDIHAATAAAIYSVPLDKVTREMRRNAKAINFGLIYGMSAFGLSRTTDLTLGESENFVKSYFEQFPGVKKYLDGIRRLAAEQGYVETLLGRRRYFPNLRNATNFNVRNREEREAINAPIQGTAADIMKIAMIHLARNFDKSKFNAKMILQVHDEMLLVCPRNELRKTAKFVQETMEKAYTLSIPLLTDARWGKNWGEMQSLSTFLD